MKTFTSEGKEITVPDIDIVDHGNDIIHCKIAEGEFANVEFKFGNLRMDDEDDTLLWYDCDVVNGGVTTEVIKPVVDNFILSILHDQVERMFNEQRETDSERNPDS